MLRFLFSILNKCDPSYWVVDRQIHLLIILKERAFAIWQEAHPEENDEKPFGKESIVYILQNVIKHRLALWAIGLFAWYFWSELYVLPQEILLAFMGIAFTISGALIVGWFAMSLKSLPSRYGFLGILITGFMFFVFMWFATVLPIGTHALTENVKLSVGTCIAIVILYEATMLYDFADVLNIGLEPLQKAYFENPRVQIMGALIESLQGLVHALAPKAE